MQIEMQGARGRDFTQAYKEAGFSPRQAAAAKESGYTWHHVKDFDPATGKSTMQLVTRTGHEATLPHAGSVEQYEKHFGVKYDTPAAVEAAQKKGWLKGKIPNCK